MTTSSDHEKYTVVQKEWPLRFKQHGFVAYCYDTMDCSVLYDDDYFVKDEDGKVTPSTSSYGPDYRKNWGGGAHLGIRNFPSPATVAWKTKDGISLVAKVDIAGIFKDQRILHNVAKDEIPEGAKITVPTIILVVDGRTINVYMKAHIPLRQPSIPGNKYSDFKNDLVLAYRHTY